MYNSEIKNNYLESSASTSRKAAMKNVFATSEHFEAEIGKDLFDFNMEEFEVLFRSLSLSSTRKGRVCYIAIEDYIGWASCQGYKKSNINLLSITESKWVDKFVV